MSEITNLIKIINSFSKVNILVIGDLILDEYIWGDVSRISPEAPVPIVWAKKRTFVPGGAANVANNLQSFGAKVSVAGVVGQDSNRTIMLKELKSRKIDVSAIVQEKGRYTTLKSRVLARNQQLMRIDWEHTEPIQKSTRDKLVEYIEKNIRKFDGIVIEDYGKGLFTDDFIKSIIGMARGLGKIVTVDPKEDNFESYYGVTAITPNRKEAENAIRYLKIRDKENKFKFYKSKLETDEDIQKAGFAILAHLGLESLLITLGEQGMWLFEKSGKDKHIPTVAQEVFDVSGAGDTTIATFTLALASGASKIDAAYLANFASGIVVGKVGTATTTKEELIQSVKG